MLELDGDSLLLNIQHVKVEGLKVIPPWQYIINLRKVNANCWWGRLAMFLHGGTSGVLSC